MAAISVKRWASRVSRCSITKVPVALMVGVTSAVEAGAKVLSGPIGVSATGVGWGGLYSETTANYTLLDTVARALVNVGGTNYIYFPLYTSAEASVMPADSARFIFQIGVGDSLLLRAKITGQ